MFKRNLKEENLKEENLKAKEVNKNLNSQLEINKAEEINLLNNVVMELLNLQEINSLGIEEKEKNKHRNIIINSLIENCLDKINELSSTRTNLR